ncbi:fibronectin type III domain-containing protein [Chryseolinea lacunae]|uniref:T9SS type A sorting domain-containing protein n=1 Tax=Chryseolinea lacunae TaxID=2801331 RepID=A0ABS1KXN7_9BACT|nr:PA14 domain-containing protein [Chryseolinea lacunae]MBL0744243.1 T9SS type A sorting domain-containing protein [Chryseolinea lacunae]
MPPNGVTYNTPTKTWTFSEPGKLYPMIIFLHGAGETGTDNNNQLKHGGQRHRDAVKSGLFPGFLFYEQSSTLDQIKAQLEKMISILPIDINRIYIHGLSGGGGDTWKFTIANPTLIAAAFPMSASNDDAKQEKMLYIPLRQSQGERDNNPNPGWTQTIVDWFNTNGGHLEYFYLPGVGHGTWETMYARPDFFPWFLSHKKNEILVLFNRNELCPGVPTSATMGFTPGFDAYEWRKDGVLIPGATTYKITATQFGVYTGRIKNRGVWSEWSAPVEVKTKQPTYTPAIVPSANKTIVLPAPDGSTTTSLEEPEGYSAYVWRNAATNAIVANTRVFSTATVGTYKATVTEVNGCSSVESPVFTVVNANGPNKPDGISGFLGYANTQTQITLAWSDNPTPQNNETGFEIYRGATVTGPFTLLTTTAANANTYVDSDLTPNTTYYYLVRPINASAAGPISTTIGVATKVDATPPTAPLNLVVAGSTKTSVTLVWEAATDNVGVYRYDIFKNGTKVLAVNGLSTTVYNLTPNEVYNFVVKARDVTGNLSPESNQVTAASINNGLNYKVFTGSWTVLPDFNTLTPVKLGNTPNIDLSVRTTDTNFAMYWEGYITIPVAGNYTFETYSDDGSKVYIGGYGASYQVVNNDGAHGLQYRTGTKNFATAGTYPIVITYFNITGTGTMQLYWKNTASGIGSTRQLIPDSQFKSTFTYPDVAPAFPTQLAASAVAYNQINLTWKDNSTNETGFQLYRATATAGPYAAIAIVPANTTSYSDKAVDPATKYFYRVKAIGRYGESTLSNEITRGVAYSYYEQTLTTLANINSLTPTSTGTSTGFDLTPRKRDANIAFKWVGKIKIATTGNYTFFTTSDDGSVLFIDGVQRVANDFNQGMTERSGVVNNLTAGVHDIVVSYRNGTGGFGLEVRYQGPGVAKQLIPSTVLADDDVNATTLPLPAAPAAPTSLAASPLSKTSINVSWTDASTTETAFELYRSVHTSTSFVLFKTLPPNTTSFLDEGLFPNETYFYKVSAVGTGGSTSTAIVSATTLNTPPVITGIADIFLKYGKTLTLSVVAQDDDHEPLTLTTQNLPAFATFSDQGDGTGTLVFTPQLAHLGQYPNIRIFATDQHTGKDTATFKFVVTDKDVPNIVPVSDVTMSEGQTRAVTITASSDAGTQNLIWEAVDFPAFASLSSNAQGVGTVTLTPDYIHSGDYSLTVKVKDNVGGESARTFKVSVGDVNPNSSVSMNLVYSTSAVAPWNNITSKTTTALKDNTGATTTVGLDFQTTAWNTWFEGAVTGNNSGVYPDAVISDYYYFGIFGAPNTVDVKVTGLNPARNYTLSFLASSKWTGVSDNGTTTYTIGAKTVSVGAQNNSSTVGKITSVTPAADGSITFTMSKEGASQVGYLNALVVESVYQDGTAPAAPRALDIALNANNEAKLVWVDAPFNENGFDVFRSLTKNGTYTKVNAAAVAANGTTYTDATVVEDTKYYYKVRSFNDAGVSAYSNIDSISVPNLAPKITLTGSLALTRGSQSTVTVSATDLPANQLTIAVTGLPSFATYQQNTPLTGTITFNPTSANLGVFSFTVKATDNKGAATTKDVTVTVSETLVYRISLNFSQSSNAAAPWNNTSKAPAVNDVFANLKDDGGVNRNVSVTLTSGFGGAFNEGAVTGSDSGVVPDAVLREYYWFGAFNAPNAAQLKVSGLSKLNKYTFKFVASSNFTNNGSIINNGSTVFTIGSRTSSVNVQGNTSNLAVISDVVTNANGEVTVDITKAGDATVGYINGLIIEAVAIDPSGFAPTSLIASANSKTNIIIGWSDNSPTETGFEVYRSTTTADGVYSLIGTTATDVATYTDNTGATNGKKYYYKVRAIIPGGFTGYSNVASAGTIAFAVYININGVAAYDAPAPWNNLSRLAVDNDVFYNLRDESGNQTGLRLRFEEAMEGMNDWGMSTGNNSGIFPDKVLKSFYYTNAYNGIGKLTIEGLDQGFNYNFGFLGAIDVALNVTTNFTIGSRTVSNRQDQNISNVGYLRSIVPDQNSEVKIAVQEALGSPWSILNAIVIEAYPTDDRSSGVSGGRTETKGGTMREVRYGESNPQVVLYPNPTQSELNIKTLDSSIGDIRYAVVDQMGKVVKEGTYTNDEVTSTFSLDLQGDGVKNSIYFLKLAYPDGKVQVKKFVKY